MNALMPLDCIMAIEGDINKSISIVIEDTNNRIINRTIDYIPFINNMIENSMNVNVNFMNMNSRDKNILMALAIGNITNMAKKVNAQKGLYKSCFPQEKIVVGIDRNSSLSKKNYSEHIMYNEIFMIQKNMLKLNLVTKMPNEIVLKIKKNYGQFIKTCFEKNISPIKNKSILNIRKSKKVKKGTKGVKGVKGKR